MTLTKRRLPSPSAIQQPIRMACRLLSLAGLRPEPEKALCLIEDAPRDPQEGEQPDEEDFCAYLLICAGRAPLTQDRYRELERVSHYWLDVWPAMPQNARKRLLRAVRQVLAPFGQEEMKRDQ